MGGDELSPEEMQMLAELTGMYAGGVVQQGYQTGGMVAPITQEDFMRQAQEGSQFRLPPSIFAPSAPSQPGAVFAPITLYGPSGEPMVATSQEEYNNLIAQGYTTQPRVTQPSTEASGGGGGGGGIEEPQVTGGGGFSLNDEKLEALRGNPLSFGSEALQGGTPMGLSSRQMAGAGSLVGGMPGMIAGGLAGAAFELDNIAQARAALEVARAQGQEGTEAFKKLETDITSAVNNLSGPARALERLGIGSGKSYTQQALAQTAAPAVAPATARVPVAGSGGDSGSSLAPTTSPTPTPRPERSESDSWTGGAVASNQSAPSPSRTSEQARSDAQAAADRLGTPMATGGRATGGLVAKRKKLVAKKK
jgi:hypothetical protein